jgi:hypothetical protein
VSFCSFRIRRVRDNREPSGARRIVEAFDELENDDPGLGVRSEVATIYQLALECGDETLAHRIVVGVADRACRWTDAGLLAAIAGGD